MEETIIRSIQEKDNPFLASIIRRTLEEFGANRQGTVYTDPTTDNLYQLFQKPGSAYFVAEQHGKILGGGGIFPTEGLPHLTCELVKMYLLPESRGLGLGKKIISLCLETALSKGYHHIYIETMPELKKAMSIYEQFGFTYLSGPIGNSGHFGCEIFMMKELKNQVAAHF